jgi:predicted nucleic acid-binding protein
MILPDTSWWIDLLRSAAHLDEARRNLRQFVTCGPVLQEVLQGWREDSETADLREALLNVPAVADPMPLEIFLQAAEIYREGRRRGYAIRSTTDCLIAAIAIEHGATVWHKDRDFTVIARYTPLRVRSEYLN